MTEHRYSVKLEDHYGQGRIVPVAIVVPDDIYLASGSTLVFDRQRQELVLRFKLHELPPDKEGA